MLERKVMKHAGHRAAPCLVRFNEHDFCPLESLCASLEILNTSVLFKHLYKPGRIEKAQVAVLFHR